MKKELKIVMIYLNNAATTLFKPPEVIKAATISALSVGRSAGFDATAERLSALREKLLKLTNARDHFVVLTSGCTFALNQAILGLAARLPPCRILVTQAAHNAVLRPVYALAKRRFPCAINAADEFGRVTPETLAPYLTPDVKIVVISHMSNVTGGIDDIAAITKLLRSRGIYSIVDCAQSVGIMNVDLSNIDIAAFPFHKSLHALSGIGAMIVREGIEMEPLVYGGTGTLSADKDMPDFPPERYEAGTHNLPAINAALAALDWLEKYEEEIRGNLDYIGKRLYNGLYDLYPKVKILSCDNPGAIVTFVTTDADFDSAVFAQSLYDHGFVVRGGLHCAPLMHERLGTSLSGAVRVSPGIDTTETQIDSFLLTVKRLISP